MLCLEEKEKNRMCALLKEKNRMCFLSGEKNRMCALLGSVELQERSGHSVGSLEPLVDRF